jgi:hypothetical protein
MLPNLKVHSIANPAGFLVKVNPGIMYKSSKQKAEARPLELQVFKVIHTSQPVP